MIDNFKRCYDVNFTDSNDIKFTELNQRFCSYQNINLGLISAYTITKYEYLKEQRKFESWFDEKYITVKSELNPRTVASQKWIAAKEIDVETRVRYRDEYNEKKDKLITLERKTQFLKRLLDSWAAQQFVLSDLSKNLRAEVAGLNIDSIADRFMDGD